MNFITNHLAQQKSTQRRLQASEPTLETSVQAAFAKHVLEGASLGTGGVACFPPFRSVIFMALQYGISMDFQ
jgi:hypothetical protein